MATQITNSFIADYEARVHEVFQRTGSYLLNTVRHRPNVVGSTTTFQKIGKGTATTKSRHGSITPMNQTHTAVTATLADFYAGDWVDRLDEAKINIDERMVIANGGAMALGRKVDDQITTVLDTTSQGIVSWTVTSKAAVRNALLDMVRAAHANDVPNDGQLYGLLTARAWAHAMTVDQFSNADWIGTDGQTFRAGFSIGSRFKDFMGVKWQMHTGLPGKDTATAKVFVYHKMSVGYASAASAGNIAGNGPVTAEIQYHNDHAAWFVDHMMSGGCVMVEDAGVIEGNLDDTAALATS